MKKELMCDLGGGEVKLEDYCDAINAEIVVRRFPAQNNRWIANFDHCEVKENEAILKGEYGTGTSPESAISEYIRLIEGKKIVFNAMSDKYRREFNVPKGIEPMKNKSLVIATAISALKLKEK